MSSALLERERAVLASLMRSPALAGGNALAAVRQATEAAAELLSVRRASVWRFDEARTTIECIDLFDAETRSHSSGAALYASEAPTYFAATLEQRVIASEDALRDPRTREFASSYLEPLGIAAMLDAPVLVHGELAGIVCLEHMGAPRVWEPAEELVAGTVADFVGMALGTAAHIEQARELAVLRGDLEQLVEQRTRELVASQTTVRRLFETSPVGLVVTRLDDQTVLVANERASSMFGVPMESARGQRAPDFWVRPEDREALLAKLRDGRHEPLEAELTSATGRRFWGLVSASIVDFEGTAAVVVGVHDITAQKAAENSLRTLLEAAPIPLVVTGLDDAVVRFANKRAADMFKTTTENFVGKRAPDFYVNPDERRSFVETLRTSGRVEAFAARLRAADGSVFWSLLSARTLELDGVPAFMVGFADLTEQKEIERRLRDLAELDGLTGAFNRRHFFDVGSAALARMTSRGGRACLAMIDADHFKAINDRYGHAAGDEALRMLTNVCRSASRTSDILARYGGEELVLLLADADMDAAQRVVERIRVGLASASISVEGRHSLVLSVSIGLAEYRPGESLDEMLRRADRALYEAKRAGRDRVVVAA
ncbi:MAG TPA: diguanylate cyclase [Labilithrix sp.]|nr:diguanylate cyclase [Labilithrix sp.]